MKKHIASVLIAAVALLGAATARANVAAIYAEGHGGMESGRGTDGVPGPGLGFQLGARLLIFEGYLDHTGFGEGAAVTRGVFGLRGAVGLGQVRLVLRGGLGAIQEQGGALTGHVLGAPERRGGVARAGVALEGELSPRFLLGFGVDGESFVLSPGYPNTSGTSGSIAGSDVFASLKLMFELGI